MAIVYTANDDSAQVEEILARAKEIPNVAEILEVIARANKLNAVVSASTSVSSLSPRLGNVYYASCTRMM
ncbi:hypothetical protein [Sinorhizobium meliloti]|uniref:hypothetical protein n=1 Tax=Rhizobium meliloti TaxID=382 RepID=UPI000B498D06|nr:hypothetical protein [Sinorhizobium meliloti]ASP92758.1 hypothetical protein CDO25_17465 [Sinorhizobium meliloti]MQX55964.1 hypothetical protein [Sinorhizobium meliloti]